MTQTAQGPAKQVAKQAARAAARRAAQGAARGAIRGVLPGQTAARPQRGPVARAAQHVGKGLLAGLAGTVAMTASSTLEMKLRGRGGSSAPADAAAKMLGISSFTDDDAKARFGTMVHWGYGTGGGAVRGLLSGLGFGPRVANGLHGLVVWGSEQMMLPALDVAPPLTQWGAKEIAVDAWHHTVYVVATGLAYERLDASSAR